MVREGVKNKKKARSVLYLLYLLISLLGVFTLTRAVMLFLWRVIFHNTHIMIKLSLSMTFAVLIFMNALDFMINSYERGAF